MAPLPAQRCALSLSVRAFPRGLVGGPGKLSPRSHTPQVLASRCEDKSHDIFKGAMACLLSRGGHTPGPDLNGSVPPPGFPARNLQVRVLPRLPQLSSRGLSRRTFCWPCPAKNLPHKDRRTQSLQALSSKRHPWCTERAVSPRPPQVLTAPSWAGPRPSACSFQPSATASRRSQSLGLRAEDTISLPAAHWGAPPRASATVLITSPHSRAGTRARTTPHGESLLRHPPPQHTLPA